MAKITNPEEPAEPTQPEVLPTEQLPVETPPVAATMASTESTEVKEPSAIRRHPVTTAIVAGAVAVLLAIGLTAWGVGSAVTASLTSATGTTSAPTSTSAPTTPAALGGRKAFRGTIQSVSGDTWTILTKAGKTITVSITSTTAFGTPRKPAEASSFATGDDVILVATGKATSTLTALRVVAPRTSASTPVPTSTPTT